MEQRTKLQLYSEKHNGVITSISMLPGDEYLVRADEKGKVRISKRRPDNRVYIPPNKTPTASGGK